MEYFKETVPQQCGLFMYSLKRSGMEEKMRKLVLVLTCCMLAGLTACGGNEETKETGTPTPTAVVSEEDTKNNAQEDANASQTVKANGYVFTYDGTEVSVDADASVYVAKFGEPSSYYETPSCAFDDLDKFYTYQGFELDTYYSNGSDLVLSVVLLDDTVSTTEGICIGDAQKKVAKVYGEASEQTDNSVSYQKDNMKLVFIFKDGVVAAIEYKSLVLDAQ